MRKSARSGLKNGNRGVVPCMRDSGRVRGDEKGRERFLFYFERGGV